jgi:hypothetical protein
MGAGGDAGSSSTAPTQAPSASYPAGPYGTDVGQTLPQLCWDGIAEGKQSTSRICSADVFDPNGTRTLDGKPINSVVFVVSATWCGNCEQEIGILNTRWLANPSSAPGLHIVLLETEQDGRAPASFGAMQAYRQQMNLSAMSCAIDPGKTLVQTGAFPFNVVVDPRTMKVVFQNLSFNGVENAMTDLARSNDH